MAVYSLKQDFVSFLGPQVILLSFRCSVAFEEDHYPLFISRLLWASNVTLGGQSLVWLRILGECTDCTLLMWTLWKWKYEHLWFSKKTTSKKALGPTARTCGMTLQNVQVTGPCFTSTVCAERCSCSQWCWPDKAEVTNVNCDYSEWTVLCLVIHSCIDCITPRSMRCANLDGLILGADLNPPMHFWSGKYNWAPENLT